jgi:lipoprotein NlpD
MTRFLSARVCCALIYSVLKDWQYLFCYILMFLLLFGCTSRNKPAEVIALSSSIPLKNRIKHSISGSQYVVKKGETLYSIAWRANSDVRQLATLNKISSPYKIYPGQKLFLVTKKLAKSTKASKDKTLLKKSTKNSGPMSKKSTTKALASTKKQAYGKNVGTNKIVQKSLPKTNFSKKIKRWQWPVKGKIIEYFSNSLQGNKGINIAGRRSTQIRAAANGKVVYAGDALRGYGKLIIIKHNDDYLSAYAHNDQIFVKEEQQIKLGDVISKMGSTDAPSVMLHFEVRFRGKSVNPLNYLPKR